MSRISQFLARLLRGRRQDPAWARPTLLALLALTTFAYLWDLGSSGWANAYYAAAVQAGTKSWKAMLFGSTDAANFITVDKSPASLWPMEISARIFGLNSWSMLVPQAMMGIGAVAVLHATIRRWFGSAAGLIAAAVMATTPVAAMMFRFNNPDALLVFLLVLSAYSMTRAIEADSVRWVVAVGVCVGFAFLAKELQAFLVLPFFAVAYLWTGPSTFMRRFVHMIYLGLATILSAGWWIAAITLTPSASRPYVGGSHNNSFFDVLFGYNGFGRLTGNETGSVGGGPQGTGGRWGATGWLRMFGDSFGSQVSWLLPTALGLGVVGLVITAIRPRTDRHRAALLLWGGWLFVTGTAFSLGQGIIHQYYAIALAPAIGAVIGVGSHLLWQYRATWLARIGLGTSVAGSAWWVTRLLRRSPQWFPGLRSWLLPVAIAIGLAIVVVGHFNRRVLSTVAIAGLAITLFAPTAATATTARTPHSGPIPIAGPASVGGRLFGPRGPGGPGAANGRGGAPRAGSGGSPNGAQFPPGLPPGLPSGGFPGGLPGGQLPPGFPRGGFVGFTPLSGGQPTSAQLRQAFGGGRGGGLLNASRPGPALTKLLVDGQSGFRWTAAAVGAMSASGYQLAARQPVMAIGGFNGSDPTPTLAAFQVLVRNHQVHYFLGGGLGGFPGGGPGAGSGAANTSSAISTWVGSTFSAKTVDGITLYDLTAPTTTAP